MVVVLSAARTAAAQPSVDELVAFVTRSETRQVVERTVARMRRSIAIGPTVGTWGGYAPSPASTDVALALGVGIETFDIGSLPDVQELVVEKTKAKLRERLEHAQGIPSRAELEELAREVYAEAKADALAQLTAAPRTFEPPKLGIALEADRLSRADVWQLRLRAGVGVGPVTVGATAAYGFGDSSVHVGPEIVAHALLSDGARTPLLDAFVRYDFEVAHREMNTDTVVVGARFLLDAI